MPPRHAFVDQSKEEELPSVPPKILICILFALDNFLVRCAIELGLIKFAEKRQVDQAKRKQAKQLIPVVF